MAESIFKLNSTEIPAGAGFLKYTVGKSAGTRYVQPLYLSGKRARSYAGIMGGTAENMPSSLLVDGAFLFVNF